MKPGALSTEAGILTANLSDMLRCSNRSQSDIARRITKAVSGL